ncbi:hypothetical protein [Leptodesmis sichuanensis]|uniref:hypothetical protein n=1 Tax=Leptodesmis sichuanensis TaxID=2906798 RepID=UPI001F377EEA|nr:hypothetical protein [Leptodesmis sichuanensis]UIE36227.1 hypothetical protein KIK02_14245 [Leptodesmis sichuanensis A121]
MSPDSTSPLPEMSSHIQQEITGDRNQAIGQVYGGIVVYVSGGQAVFNPAATDPSQPATKKPAREIGANPYKGLLAFQEADSGNFFGRSRLW